MLARQRPQAQQSPGAGQALLPQVAGGPLAPGALTVPLMARRLWPWHPGPAQVAWSSKQLLMAACPTEAA
jgi:hypothetical protein